jgi:hypothetical protein
LTKSSSLMDWLLEDEQPSVVYHVLKDVVGKKDSDEQVRRVLAAIPVRGWAPMLLADQHSGGYWESKDDLYRPKYQATIWKLIVLADLGMTAKDERVRKSCELFLDQYHRDDGGFDSPPIPEYAFRRSEHCITGNLTRTLIMCGYEDHPRVRSALDQLVKTQEDDGGWHCFYEQAHGRGTLDCWEGLSAYAAFPRQKWSRSIKRSAERGTEFYLARRLSEEGSKRYLPWLRFHYPVHYFYDVLIGLDVITSLGYADDKRLLPALSLLKKKRRSDGRWVLDKVHPDIGRGADYRMNMKKVRPLALEEVGKPSKWITLTALRVLNRVGEDLPHEVKRE